MAKDSSTNSTLTTAIILVVFAALIANAARPWRSWSHDDFWKIDRPLADPAALYADGGFDVYTTSAAECIPGSCPTYRVPRFSSPSLSTAATLRGDAMPDLPPWVDRDDRAIWAPSVAKIGTRYVVYFTATAATGPNPGAKCLGAGVSPTAAGPFSPAATPLVCANPGFWDLDPYAVSDGANWFLLWREDDAGHVQGKIVGAQLSPDGLGFRGAVKRTLLVGESAWEDGSGQGTPAEPDEKANGIGPIENPAMARHPDTGEWLLTWSANRWDSPDYATGLAICQGPLGPCQRQSRGRPWLRTSDDPSIDTSATFTGAGGLSFVAGPDGHLSAVFHAYRGTGPASDATRIGWAYRVEASNHGYKLTEF